MINEKLRITQIQRNVKTKHLDNYYKNQMPLNTIIVKKK